MEFFIELTNDQTTYRLQNDKTWHLLNERQLKDKDYLTSNVSEIIKLQEIDRPIDLNGRQWKLNPTSSSFGDESVLTYQVYTNRDIIPRTPSRDQLKSIIAQGDDSFNNSLILNPHGFYELRNFHTLNFSIKDPTILHRHETFSAGNDYVGQEASEDQSLIDELYSTSLEHWLINLKYGRLNMYSDHHTQKTAEELIIEIEEIKTGYNTK